MSTFVSRDVLIDHRKIFGPPRKREREKKEGKKTFLDGGSRHNANKCAHSIFGHLALCFVSSRMISTCA